MRLFALFPILEDLRGGAGHFAAEVAVPLALAESQQPAVQRFALEVLALAEHLAHLFAGDRAIGILMHDIFHLEARRLLV